MDTDRQTAQAATNTPTVIELSALKEMSVTDPQPVPRLNVTISTLPTETTVVVLEQRGRT